MLLGKRVRSSHDRPRRDPRRNVTSAEQSRGRKMWSAIKSNIPDRSMDKDKYQEGTGQRKATKYLRKSYYHHIKCSATNSLAALMRKWFLNSSFQPSSYYPKTSKMCWWDKTQHQQSELHVEGRDGRER